MAGEFSKAEEKRVALVNNESVAIKNMYRESLRDIAVRIKFLETRTNISSVLRVQYLEELRKEIQDALERIDTYTYKAIVNDMETVAQAVVQDNSQLLKQMGFSDALSSTAFLHVPKDIVNEIITGKLYEGRWSLSRAIWNDNALKNKELETIVAKGVALQKSTYDIAKDLEKYVNPRAQKPWDWGKVYPGVRKVIDYNAQRLARTMVSHAYQESFVRTTQANPFIEAYKWLISNSDRVCPLCIERSTTDSYNLGAGVYPKDQLPLDHPNGMCTFSIVMVKSYTEIADDLANWVQGVGNKDLNEKLDAFAESLHDVQLTKRQVSEQQKIVEALPRQMHYIEEPLKYEELPDYVQDIGEGAYNKSVAKLAKKYKMTTDGVQEKLDEAFVAMVDNSDFGMRISIDSLLKALEDGSFKNQHEAGQSRGFFNPKVRLNAEHTLFNVPKRNGDGVTDADRPIYAMLLPKYNNTAVVNQYYKSGPGSWYGDGITVIFSREKVINQATLTIGDSFDYSGRIQAMLASSPKCTGSFNHNQVNTLLMQTDISNKSNVTESMIQMTSGGKKHDQYIEAQFHGKQSHSAANIEKVMLDKERVDEYGMLVDILTEKKIPFEWI